MSELYTIHAETHPDAADPYKRWILVESHGYWDEPTKKFVLPVVTLSPDAANCLKIEEAHAEIEKQILSRALKSGFKYVFQISPCVGRPWHERYEIMPDGSYKLLPPLKNW